MGEWGGGWPSMGGVRLRTTRIRRLRRRGRREAARFVEPLGSETVEEFFDIGQSRSLPWERRDGANRVLQSLKTLERGWAGWLLVRRLGASSGISSV